MSGNPEVSRHLGMRASSKKAVRLGGHKALWLQYSIRGKDRGREGDRERDGERETAAGSRRTRS